MKRTLLTALSILAAATLGFTPAPVSAAEKPVAAGEKKAEKAEVKDATGKTPAAAAADATKEAAGRPLPFTGKATKVDAAGKSFSLNGKDGKDRVFVIDDATKITKDGKPATLADLTVGEAATGSYIKAGDVQTAKSLKVGGATAKVKEGADPTKGTATTPTGAVDPAKGGAGAPSAAGATPAVKAKKP